MIWMRCIVDQFKLLLDIGDVNLQVSDEGLLEYDAYKQGRGDDAR